jgi:hypothetical protein
VKRLIEGEAYYLTGYGINDKPETAALRAAIALTGLVPRYTAPGVLLKSVDIDKDGTIFTVRVYENRKK